MSLPVAMGWRHLLFANWSVDPEDLAPHLPEALEVDTRDGAAWLSVVPFYNVDVRPRGLPAWTGFELPELNLRTYVRHRGRPGVYFFSLDAEGLLGVLAARVLHHLPYYNARMAVSERGEEIHFRSRRVHPGARPVTFTASYEPVGDPFEATSDPLASFLTERYRYFTEDTHGAMRTAEIRHDPWTLQNARATIEADQLFRANGFESPTDEPLLYYARGLDITASRNRRLE